MDSTNASPAPPSHPRAHHRPRESRLAQLVNDLQDSVRAARYAVDDIVDALRTQPLYFLVLGMRMHAGDSDFLLATSADRRDPQGPMALPATADVRALVPGRGRAAYMRQEFHRQSRWAQVEKKHRLSQIMALPNTTIEKMKLQQQRKQRQQKEEFEFENALLCIGTQNNTSAESGSTESVTNGADCSTEEKEPTTTTNCAPEFALNVTDRTPDVADRAPDVADRTPDVADRTPDVTDRTPDVAVCAQDVADRTPNVADPTPHVAQCLSLAAVTDGADQLIPTNCSICLETFDPERVLKQLPCAHVFHIVCLSDWLKNNKSCPLCRLQVLQ